MRVVVVCFTFCILVAIGGQREAYAQNPFENFFNSIGRAFDDNKKTKKRANSRQKTKVQTRTNINPNRQSTPKAKANPQTRKVQLALNNIGFNAGNPDGVYGKRTGQAIAQFQSSIGRTASGRLSPEEMDILFERSREIGQAGSATSSLALLKDSLPEAGQSAYFDYDEDQDDPLTKATVNN